MRVSVSGLSQPATLFPHRAVRREVFLGFADYYITRARELACRLDGQPMTVRPFQESRVTLSLLPHHRTPSTGIRELSTSLN